MDCSRLQEDERRVDLEVLGRRVLLFDDDSTAAFVSSSDALVPWCGGDPSLLIDRFDARHLLQKIPSRGSYKSLKSEDNLFESDGVSRIELDGERYRDLVNVEDGPDREDDSKENVRESDSYRTVPFSYNSCEDSKYQEQGLESSCYRPPFHVPDYLLSSLPPTEKVHQIIARTAKFVSEHGGQTEIILRVKQGGNPTFGFLMPDNRLHPYFRFLVEHPELSKIAADVAGRLDKEKTPDLLENKPQNYSGALSLLGSVYGSGEDDGIPDKTEVRETASVKDTTVPTVKSSIPDSCPSVETKVSVKASATVNPILPLKSHSSPVVMPSGTARNRLKDVSSGSTVLLASKPPTESSKVTLPFVEPPSSLQRMVEKTVEFISRNGREFETSLILQDKMNEKFPFLRPSSTYHSYYLKVLHQTREENLASKRSSDDSSPETHTAEKRREAPFQLDRKEKFKMALGSSGGSSRQDAVTSSPKPSKPPGMSAEEAAAIVMGATRGLARSQSPAEGPKIPLFHIPEAIRRAVDGQRATSTELPSRPSADDEQQKLKAERLKRAKEFAAVIQSRKLKLDESQPAEAREDRFPSLAKPRREEESRKRANGKYDSHRRRHREDPADDDKRRQRRHRSSTLSKRNHSDEEGSGLSRHSHKRRHEEKASSRDDGKAREGTEPKPSSQATEIPDDLRLKIRAMLQATR
ncbi:SWAP (Suppressor-of-White-APricot)/surp domain-containing protein [Wolffia australiana]